MADELLRNLYYDPSSEASFSGIVKLYNAAKKHLPKITRKEVDEWLRSQQTYRKHRFIRGKFPRLPVIGYHIDSVWQLDLLQLLDWANDNKIKGKPTKFLLIGIDVLSRYAMAEPMADKTSKETAKALTRIFQRTGRYPKQIETDQGKEFAGPPMKKLFEDLNIVHRWRPPRYKTAIAERVIQTLRNKIFKFMDATNTSRYVDDLQSIVDGYNNSYHRMLKMKPSEVTKENEREAFTNLYGHIIKRGIIDKPKYKKGDLVNRFLVKSNLTKGSDPRFETDELYEIVDVDDRRPPRHVYRIRNYFTKEEVPWVFYDRELVKVPPESVDLSSDKHRAQKKIRVKRGPGRKKV